MDHTPTLFPLKLLVITLGLLLAGALTFMLAVIARKAMGDDRQSYYCQNVTMHRGERSAVSAIVPQGDKVQVMLKGENTVLTFDHCTGTLSQHLTVTP